MIKPAACLTVLAALLAACEAPTSSGKFGGPDAGTNSTASVITMTPALAITGSTVTFSATGLFDHEDYTRDWDFGDGAQAEGLSVAHIFQNPGAYEMRLVGSDGATTRTATMTVNVAPAGSGTLPPPLEIRRP